MNRKIVVALVGFMLLFSLACKSINQVTPSGLDDNAIEIEVRAKIAEDAASKALGVGVKVDNGVVTLSGHADSAEQRRKIGMAANDVKGVKSVINNIHVKP